MKKKLSDAEIESQIAQVNASFSMEGMALTEFDKDLIRRSTKGELTMDEVKKIIVDRLNIKPF